MKPTQDAKLVAVYLTPEQYLFVQQRALSTERTIPRYLAHLVDCAEASNVPRQA